ncbi:MAG TPA: hypothetical protein VIL46_06155, partial [Gemmataceae bacterium]
MSARRSEFRQDPVTGRWVIIAPERADRPILEPRSVAPPSDDLFCPFCAGFEYETPGEVLAFRQPGSPPDQPGWRVRVVPNRYPAVRPADGVGPPRSPSPEGALPDAGEENPAAGTPPFLFRSVPGCGAHEVIIESPEHETQLSRLPAAHVAEVLRAYRDRLRFHARDPGLAYGLVFKNSGAAAGASLEHLHSQLVALPFVPPAVREELDGAARYLAARGRCVFCEMLAAEREAGLRTVREWPRFAAFAPFASRFTYETWLLPRAHRPRFEDTPDEELPELADALRTVLA